MSFFSLISVIAQSVVRSRPEIDDAFCKATRSTLVGTMTPASTRSSNSWLTALKPKLVFSASSTFAVVSALPFLASSSVSSNFSFGFASLNFSFSSVFPAFSVF